MLDAIKKAYRYYFYRMYLYTLSRWNNKKSVAIVFTDLSMAAPLMLNFYTLIVLLHKFFNIWFLPDYKTHKIEIFIAISILGVIYIYLNNKYLINKLDDIIHEFKNEDKKSSSINGWIVAIYVIGSFAAFWGLGFATIGG